VSIQFDKTLTNIMSSLMMVTSVILIVPTTMSEELLPPDILEAYMDSNDLILSRSIAIILSILFVIYLYFQLQTHADLYLDPLDDGNITNQERHNRNVAGEEQGPTLSPWIAFFVLITTIGCVIKCASYLVNSIGGVVNALHIGRTFIGLVLLPTIGNTAKFVTVVTMAMRNRIDFTIRAILGSVLQITLVIAPFLVLLGWILEQPMKLSFDIFGATVFLLAIMVVNYIIQDGKTNYFEGFMLVGTYVNRFSIL
jgi:Ca2+:H+ antiporter